MRYEVVIIPGHMETRACVIRYPALVDGEKGAYGVSFPDIDGVVAMGVTVDEALLNAEDALSDYLIEMEKDGARPVSPSLVEETEVSAGSALVLIPHEHL